MAFSGLMMYAPDPTKAENLNVPVGAPNFVQPGALQLYNGELYRFVIHNQGTGSVVTTVGGWAFWYAHDTFVVTSDKTSCEHGATTGSGVVGVYNAVVTHLNGTWIQMTGVHASVLTDGAGAIGQILNCPASDGGSNDMHVAAWTTVATQIVGVQVATVSATRVKAHLWLPIY